MFDVAGDFKSSYFANKDKFKEFLTGDIEFETKVIDFGESSFFPNLMETQPTGNAHFRPPEGLELLRLYK